MPRFTSANAREMAAKAHLARRLKTDCGELAEKIPPQDSQDNPLEPLDPYVASKLSRVRRQLTRLDDMLDDETDPQKLDRLASAIARLSELERQLANRPLPGSIRRAVQKPERRVREFHAEPDFRVPEPSVEPEPLETAAVQPSISAASQTAETKPEANQGQPAGGEVRKVVWTHGVRTPAKRR